MVNGSGGEGGRGVEVYKRLGGGKRGRRIGDEAL